MNHSTPRWRVPAISARPWLVLLALAVGGSVAAEEAPPIGGVYEAAIGVEEPLPLVRYFELFGYRVGPVGQLDAPQALALYGVSSPLRSVRLLHQDADHGLVRLMAWQRPTSDGLGLAPMLAPGSRWTSTLSEDVLDLYNHAQAAERAGRPIHVVPPQWSAIYDLGPAEPFTGELAGVRELIVLQPLTRQMFFERFGYTVPRYGRVNESARFRTSQITHQGLVFRGDDPAVAAFYADVLGLKAQSLERETRYESLDAGSRGVYSMQAGQRYYGSTFDDPRSGPALEAVSGRLLLRRIPSDVTSLPDLMDRSRPGCLGLSLFTYRVRDLDAYHARVAASAARDVTAMLANEFGERSFSFRAPDGHFWTLVGR
jgi:uncharacterized glyoxalase superfamily protein PhnB